MTIIPTSPSSLFSVKTRFWAKVKRGPGCWEWTAARQPHPRGKGFTYGMFWVGSKKAGTGKMIQAHRVAWELAKGETPDGLKVLHKCDNPACVRPAHLFLGTQKDNTEDMIAKGRKNASIGERHGSAKLTQQQVIDIRAKYVAGRGRAHRGNAVLLAAIYGVARGTITDVVTRAWQHIREKP